MVRHLKPDSQWRFEGAKLSSIVLEVTKSQSYDSLEKKAKQFISDSNGGISTVVGFMLNSEGRGDERLHKNCSVMIVWIAVPETNKSYVAKRACEEVSLSKWSIHMRF